VSRADDILSYIRALPKWKSRVFEREYLSEYRRRYGVDLTFTGEEMALVIKKGTDVAPLKLHSTGHVALDEIFKFPAQRFGVVYGPPGGGKSSLLAEHVAQRQNDDKKFTCLWIAAESMDGIEDGYYHDILNVDMNRLDVVPTGDVPPMEELFNDLLGTNAMAAKNGAIEAHLRRYKDAIFKDYDLVIIDSSDGLSARQEYLDSKNKSRGLDNDNPGVKARKWSEGLRRIVAALDNLKSSLYVVSQTRSNIGGYGKLTDVTGGNAMKYYSSFRLAVKRGDLITKGTEANKTTIGFDRLVCIEKTKISANELKIANLPYLFGEGVDTFFGMLNACIGPIVTVKGAWHYYDGFPKNKKGIGVLQGRDNVVQFFKEDQTRIDKLENELCAYQKKINSRDVSVREENSAEAAKPDEKEEELPTNL